MFPKSPLLLSAIASVLAGAISGHALATVVPFARYPLGEPGSLSGLAQLPQDSSGNNRHITSSIAGNTVVVSSSGITAPGSTRYADTRAATGQGWYGVNVLTSLPTDNFAFSVYASAPAKPSSSVDILTLGGSSGAFKLSLGPNGWAASAHNVSWISAGDGIDGTFTANQWVQLALVRQNGSTTFYINGVAQGSPYSGAPLHDTPHFSVNPGGLSFFDGRLDEACIVTFDPADSIADIFTVLGGPPLPISKLVQDGQTSYPAVALAAGAVSEFRPGLDSTEIVTPGAFTVAAPHTLKIIAGAGLEVGMPYDLFKFHGDVPGITAASFDLQLPAGVQATLAIDSLAPDHYVTLTFQNLGQVKWNGTAAAGGAAWDTTSLNWLNPSATAVPFANGLGVLFDDSAAVKNVAISAGQVMPGLMEFTSADDYTISGSGSIGGPGSARLSGGKVSFSTGIDLAGGIVIDAGSTLELKQGGTGSTPITNAGTLVFNSAGPLAAAGQVTGGAIEQAGSGTTVLGKVSGASRIDVAAGVLKISPAGVGTATQIATGALLELNAPVVAEIEDLPNAAFEGGGILRKTGPGSIIWTGATGRFALSSGARIEVQAGTFVAASYGNEDWSSNLADLDLAAGTFFDTVEARVSVNALTGTGTVRSGYSGFADAAIVCGVDGGSGLFGGAIVNFQPDARGSLVKRGAGTQTLAGTNSYTGNTVIEAGTLALDPTGSLRFLIGANGVANRITGSGSVVLNGTLDLDLTTAEATPGNTWNLIDVTGLVESYGPAFQVAGFTRAAGVWTKVGASVTWSFSETTGSLTVAAGGGGGYSTWAATHAGNQAADGDFDGDGVANGIEYFMGETGSSFTVLPAPVSSGTSTKVTWKRDPAAPVTAWVVQVSTTLNGDWATVPATDVDLSNSAQVTYTFPAPATGHRFVRLSVTP